MEVTLQSRWHEILGNTRKEMSDDIRRERWEKWKNLAKESGKQGKEKVKYWSQENEACHGCVNRDDDWCELQELPCSVNPVLTFGDNIIGMACAGVGYKAAE